MPTNYQIRTQFLLEDKVSKVLDSIELKGNLLRGSLLKAEERWSALGAVAKKAAIGMAAASTAALGAGIAAATQKFIVFDDALASAGAHFGDLDVSAEDYQSHLDALKEKALEVSGSTRFMASDTAGALDKMAMAGFTSEQAMAMLAGTAAMATAAGVDLTSGVDMATDAMGAFNMVKDKLGQPLATEQLEANINHMGDVVSLATKKANFDMNMWFESVKNGASVFSSYGGTLEDFTAMAGTLANVGIKGGEAGTALRNVMQRLATPTSTAQKALDKLGITTFDSSGKMLPILDILKQFEEQLGTLPDMEGYFKALEEAGGDESKVDLSQFLGDGFDKSELGSLNEIFGQRAITSFLVLLNEGSESIGKFSAELKGAEGAASSTANAMNQSLGARIAILQSGLETLGIKFIDAFKPQAVPFIDSLTAVVADFTENTLPTITQAIQAAIPHIQEIIQTIIGHLPELFSTLSNLAPLFTFVAKTIEVIFNVVWALKGPLSVVLGLWGMWQVGMMVLLPILKVVAAAQAAYNFVVGLVHGIEIARQAAIYGTTIAIEAQNAATLGAKIGMALYSIATTIATSVQWLWNTAIMACPLAWLAGLIVLVIGIIIVLTGKWEAVTGAVDGFFAKIHEMDGFGGWILGVLVQPLETLWNMLRGIFDVIDAIKKGGLIAGIKMLGVSILQMLISPLEGLFQLFSFIPGLDKLNDKLHNWIDEKRQGILAGVEAKAEENIELEQKDNNGFYNEPMIAESPIIKQAPTQTAAVANSYSRQENFSNVNINLAEQLQSDSYGMVAPGVTLQRTASGGF